MQVVDELSDDETPQRLQEYGIRMVTPPERLGVTYNWNLVGDTAGYLSMSQSRHSHAAHVGMLVKG